MSAAAVDKYGKDYIASLPASAELDHRQAAIFLGMSDRTLYNYNSRELGPQRKKRGRDSFYTKADLMAWDRRRTTVVKAYSRET